MVVSDELRRTWKEVIVSYFKALHQNLLSGIEMNHMKHKSGSQAFRPRIEPGTFRILDRSGKHSASTEGEKVYTEVSWL
jgi:hypothetical protein